jgi:integrase
MGRTKSNLAAGRYRVGANLYKQVAASGAGSWVLRYELRSRKRWMGLGPISVFSLKEANARARAALQLIYTGIDPIDARRQTRLQEARKAVLTVDFQTAAQAFFDQHEAKWSSDKSRTAFLNTMAAFVYPVFGRTPVDQVDTALVLRAIEPIWLTKRTTAGRVRARIEAVLNWAAVRGYRTGDNPARWKGHLDQLLPAGGTIGAIVHHAAMAYINVPLFMEALRQRPGIWSQALEFTILTASRSGEVLKARWSEVDFENKVWTRPAAHMKARVEHQVPLTPRMLEILKGLPRADGDDGLIFASKPGKTIGKNTLSALVTSLGADGTVHGFRSSFRDWAGERTAFPRDLVEHALAHAVGNTVEQAYARSKLVEKRRRLMQSWEGFIAMPVTLKTGDVTPIRRRPNST